MKHVIMICECSSLEHQIVFWEDEDVLRCEIHLTTHRNIFRRFWYSLKYTFGYKSMYGAWDSMIFGKEDLQKLKTYLNERM